MNNPTGSKTSKQKKLCILLAVLVVAIAFALVSGLVQTKKEKIEENGSTVLSIDVSAVTALSWDTGDKQFAFHKDGDAWVYDADETFPTDTAQIEALLETFADFGASFTIDEVDDLSLYGLDDPECTIELTGMPKAVSMVEPMELDCTMLPKKPRASVMAMAKKPARNLPKPPLNAVVM